jgi:hypothetical protein
MPRVGVRTSTYVRGMADEIQSISLRWYRRLEGGRAMYSAVYPSMIDRDVETRIVWRIGVRVFPT